MVACNGYFDVPRIHLVPYIFCIWCHLWPTWGMIPSIFVMVSRGTRCICGDVSYCVSSGAESHWIALSTHYYELPTLMWLPPSNMYAHLSLTWNMIYHSLGHCRMWYSPIECDTAPYITFKMKVITVGKPYAAYLTERRVLVSFFMHAQKQQTVFSNILSFILLNIVSVVYIIILSISIAIMVLPYQFNVRDSVRKLLPDGNKHCI